MTTALVDLWPAELQADDVRPPVRILREQAEMLTRRTHGVLMGEVLSSRTECAKMVHALYAVAPVLDYYKVLLVRAEHFVAPVYPVQLSLSDGTDGKPANDEAEFVEILRSALQSDYAKDIVASLLAQSTS